MSEILHETLLGDDGETSLQRRVSEVLSKVVSLDAIDGMKRFANRRRWGEFVSAVQCSVSYPAAINALRSGAQWFNAGWQRVSAMVPIKPKVLARR
jgi:hypothetical protein